MKVIKVRHEKIKSALSLKACLTTLNFQMLFYFDVFMVMKLESLQNMKTDYKESTISFPSPINVLEDLFFQFEWSYEREGENEITAEVEGRWCTYHLFSLWRQDLESLIITCSMDIKVSSDKRDAVSILLSHINPKIWLGHFEVSPDDCPAYRYNLVLRGNPSVTIEQVEEILAAAVTECDRLYPALQFVLWGGKDPEEALMAAMLDTCGEA